MAKRKSKPTSKPRTRKQKLKDKYAHVREEAQLAGLIETRPEEALQPERVDPATQGEQALPRVEAMAVRNGWAVPEEKKPQLVDNMVGIANDPDQKASTRVLAFQALAKADQMQHDRDNPKIKEGDRHLHLHGGAAEELEGFAKARAMVEQQQLAIEAGTPGTIEGVLEVEAEVRAIELEAGKQQPKEKEGEDAGTQS